MPGMVSGHMGLRPHFNFWHTTRFKIPLQRPLVMGIVNVTPDSFSNQNSVFNVETVLSHSKRMVEDGADILDIGGESTRPGSTPLTSDQEWARVKPVLDELLKWNIPISIDTYHAQTMRRALDMGVDIVNDIYALRTENSLNTVALYSCGVCLMHMHGEPLSMQNHPLTGHVTEHVASFFHERLAVTDAAGISRERLVVDPGVGFGKTIEQNFQLLREQSRLLVFDVPLLVGWSRKSSLGAITGLPVSERLIPSVAAALIALQKGASIVRVHDVKDTLNAIKVLNATNN